MCLLEFFRYEIALIFIANVAWSMDGPITYLQQLWNRIQGSPLCQKDLPLLGMIAQNN